MGSPLAPILANLFMGCHEKYWIEKTQAVKPAFCKRYADDVFKSECSIYFVYIETFCIYLNTKHKISLF